MRRTAPHTPPVALPAQRQPSGLHAHRVVGRHARGGRGQSAGESWGIARAFQQSTGSDNRVIASSTAEVGLQELTRDLRQAMTCPEPHHRRTHGPGRPRCHRDLRLRAGQQSRDDRYVRPSPRPSGPDDDPELLPDRRLRPSARLGPRQLDLQPRFCCDHSDRLVDSTRSRDMSANLGLDHHHRPRNFEPGRQRSAG